MFALVKSETVPLTFELARQFKEMKSSIVERPLSPNRITFLEDKAKLGLLVNCNWITAELDGEICRINGNHSSNMLFQLNGNFPKGLFVHHDHYKVDDKADMVALFRQIDARQSSRSPGDVANAFQQSEPEMADITSSIAKLGAEAIAWWGKSVEGVTHFDGDDQYGILTYVDRYSEFLHWLDSVIGMKTPELVSKPVVAAMFATYEANKESAKDFWHLVSREGVEFEDNHPTTVLDAWLVKAKAPSLRKIKPGDIYQGCAYAWTAYRHDGEINSIKISSKKALHELIEA